MRNGIPWLQIKALYESGVKAPTLSKKFPVTKQGIMRRAKAEGWQQGQGNESWMEVAKATPIANTSAQGSAIGKRSPETIAVILSSIATGMPEAQAALAGGIHPTTLTRWKAEDAEFAQRIQQARATQVATHLQRINNAGDRGDWKADVWMLERLPETKEAFGQTQGKGGISIVLNFSRDELPGITVDGEVIEDAV